MNRSPSSQSNPNKASARKVKSAPPIRRCLATGERMPESRLIRFVVGPDNQVVPDLGAKLPGRGLWLQPSRKMVMEAVAKNLFARSAKGPALAEPGLADLVERLLADRCLGRLGLSLRAGQAVFGYEQVLDLVGKGDPGVLIEASNGSEGGRDKILGALARSGAHCPVVGCFTGEELGLAFGRDYVVHAALKVGDLSARLLVDVAKLSGFRPLCPPGWPAKWRVPQVETAENDPAGGRA